MYLHFVVNSAFYIKCKGINHELDSNVVSCAQCIFSSSVPGQAVHCIAASLYNDNSMPRYFARTFSAITIILH